MCLEVREDFRSLCYGTVRYGGYKDGFTLLTVSWKSIFMPKLVSKWVLSILVLFFWTILLKFLFLSIFYQYVIQHFKWLFQQLNLIGERDEVPIHFCDKCGLPIQLYGRMVCAEFQFLSFSVNIFLLNSWPCIFQIPCKHVFCYDCALLHEKKGEKMCPGWDMFPSSMCSSV